MQTNLYDGQTSSLPLVTSSGQIMSSSLYVGNSRQTGPGVSARGDGGQNSAVGLTAFVAATDDRLPSLADFRAKLVTRPNTWANCSLETLYEMVVRIQRIVPSSVTERARYGKKSAEFNWSGAAHVIMPPGLFNEGDEKNPELCQSFVANVLLLQWLQEAYTLPEIVAYFPPVPETLRGSGSGTVNVRLKQIREDCIKLLHDEYLVLGRLFLADSMLEKMTLFWDYLLPPKTAKTMEDIFNRQYPDPAEKRHKLLKALSENFDHYSYAVAGFYLLTERMQSLNSGHDQEALSCARLMLSYIDAAIKVVQSRNDFMKASAAVLTRHALRKGSRDAYEYRIIRFDAMLECIRPIRDALACYIEHDLLPVFMEKTFHFKETAAVAKKARKKARATSHGKGAKTPETVQGQAGKPRQRKATHNIVAPVLKEAPPVEQETKILHIEKPVEPIISGAVQQVEPSVRTEPEIPVAPALLPASPLGTPLIPVATLLNQTVPLPVIPTENPRLAGLQRRYKEIYDQIFFSHWSEARGVGMDAVEKLVTRLGGQIKGAGGSRKQIIFNGKSVATIEHRHGKDRTGELYKVSLSLLQRGLGIVGFAPPGWVDELSRTRDLVANFWDYAAKRKAGA